MRFIQTRRVGIGLGVLCFALWAVSSQAASPKPGRFEFAQVNRSYTDLATDIAPVHISGMTVQLDSPTHQLTIHANELKLVPQEDGSYLTELSLRFSGRGELLADIRMAGVPSHLEDELVVPEQTRVLYLRARFASDPLGYLVTTETMPKSLSVAIESRLGGNLVTVCQRVGRLLGLDCGGLNKAFSEIDLPLPEAGETYLIEFSQLGKADSRKLDRYLGFARRKKKKEKQARQGTPQ